ncbi:sarcosine oxidase subunit alpha [Rhizobium tropici]|uniref:Sarcosine oxidase subunit alpha n=2 Tax=Rhizobium tropici TaxID=398 RepID=A0A329YA45_RHITR|nr:sarcosine oxidase subunit alpha [Rhizobium tropici]
MRIEFSPGDTVAAALWRAGMTTLARSRKLHRHLGYSGSFTTGVLARVDGRPNVRLDTTIAKANMMVETQNTWPSARFDLLGLAQLLPSRMVYGGFEHGGWMPRSGVGYRIAERIMANLAGVARPADKDLRSQAIAGDRVALDCLVVGGGPAGIAEANRRALLGKDVALVTRGGALARSASAMGKSTEAVHERVRVFSGMELFGVYRDGNLMVGAPHDHETGAVIFEPGEAVFATGRRSIPPLVKGNHLPGVIDAAAALQLMAVQGVNIGQKVAVLGTGAETALAERLRALDVNVVHVGRVEQLVEIAGRRRVTSIGVPHRVQCDTLVHAGPWRTDPSLGFQASADGLFQMQARPLPARIQVVGAAALGDEPIPVHGDIHQDTLVCPCMDVTAGELFCHVDAGETDPEVLKRLTSCGMGTCQGFPCWENMIALLAARLRREPRDFDRPTHRPPRRSITVAQAAGLAGLVEPDR